MRTTPGALAAVLAAVLGLAGCGGPPSPASSPSASSPSAEPPRVAVVAVTGVTRLPHTGRAQPLSQPGAQDAYLRRLPSAPRAQAEDAITGLALRKGETLYAQVVHVGCQRAGADTVSVSRHGTGVSMSSSFQEPEDTECFAPVSSVAFAAVPG